MGIRSSIVVVVQRGYVRRPLLSNEATYGSSSMVDRVAAAAAGVRDVVLDALLIANVLEDVDADNT